MMEQVYKDTNEKSCVKADEGKLQILQPGDGEPEWFYWCHCLLVSYQTLTPIFIHLHQNIPVMLRSSIYVSTKMEIWELAHHQKIVPDRLVMDTGIVAARRNSSFLPPRFPSLFPSLILISSINYSMGQLYVVSCYPTTYTIRNGSTVISCFSLLYYYAYRRCHPKQMYRTCFRHPPNGPWILRSIPAVFAVYHAW